MKTFATTVLHAVEETIEAAADGIRDYWPHAVIVAVIIVIGVWV